MKRPGPGAVDLWLAAPPSCADAALQGQLEALLSEDERARLARFRFPEHRQESLVSRALCRVVLGGYLGLAPGALRFAANAWGKPELDPRGPVAFNVTNHPSLVAVAVTGGAEVGVDLEPRSRAPDTLEVADAVFSAEERRALSALPDRTAREERSLDLWTLKEAYIKARGMGVSLPLDQISIDPESAGAIQLTLGPDVGDPAGRWRLERRDVEDHRIALCVAGAPDEPLAVTVRRIVPLRDPLPEG